ncbi:MAG: hypothetical protein ACTSQI_06225 [Candidatus Helarchaeota archaeon]
MKGNQNLFFVKYCKFFNHLHFLKKIGNKLQSQKLTNISKFLKENYNLLPSEILIASFMTFFILFLPLLIIFFHIQSVLALCISIMIAFLGANKVLSYPLSHYNKIQYLLLEYSDLAFQDLLLVLNTTNSIFDAIYFISRAGYPILSEKFSNIFYNVTVKGYSPEKQLTEYLENLPSGNLKERLITVMSTKFRPSKLAEQLETLAGEKKLEYDVATKNFEGKLIIIVGFCLFFPILIALFISFLGYLANILSIIMIPSFIILNNKLKAKLLLPQFQLFGEASFSDIDNLMGENLQLTEFLHFLTYFADELIRGTPQEIALLYGVRSYNGKIKPLLLNSIKEVYSRGRSFSDGWNKLQIAMDNEQIQFLISIIDRMIKKSSKETGSRLISIIHQLNTNRELIKERYAIIKAQQFKIKFLIFIMASILGLIGGLTPLLIQLSNMISNPEATIEIHFWDSFLLSLSLFFMAMYASYFLIKLVKIQTPIRYSFWGGLVFIFFWYLTYYFL